MFTKEERLFIWEKVCEMIDGLEDGEYICVALRGEDKYGRRTGGNKNVLWVVWLSWFGNEGGKAEYCERYHKRIRMVFLLIYFIHQIKFWVLACRFVRIGMPVSVSWRNDAA